MRLLQIIYFFVVAVPVFIIAYTVIESADLIKKVINNLTT